MNKDWFPLHLTFCALRQEAPCFFIGTDTKHACAPKRYRAQQQKKGLPSFSALPSAQYEMLLTFPGNTMLFGAFIFQSRLMIVEDTDLNIQQSHFESEKTL
jgi:hypothetical protein